MQHEQDHNSPKPERPNSKTLFGATPTEQPARKATRPIAALPVASDNVTSKSERPPKTVRMSAHRAHRHFFAPAPTTTGQFEQMIEQIDDHIKLERRWAHNLAHQAEDAGFETAGEKLHAAMSALDDIRALLDDAKEALEDDAEKASGVTVKLV